MIVSVFIILILLFEGSIANFIPQAKYLDETLVFVFFIISIFQLSRKKEIKLNRKEVMSFFLIFFYFFIGIVSNIKTDIVPFPSQYCISGILSLKFILIYLFARICFMDINVNYDYLRKLYGVINIILTSYVVVVLLNIPLKFMQDWGSRYYIINTVSAGFSSPAELDFLAVSILVMQLFLTITLKKNKKYYKIICIESFVLIIFSGRIKAMTFFLLYLIILLFIKYIKKIKIRQLVLISPLTAFLAANRIQSEFIDNGGARGLLYNGAFKIAKDFFPLGSGFGTYGTDLSRKLYSPLYYIYGLNNKYGLSPDWPAYITDAQWAGIIAESGWLGFAIYLFIIILLTSVIVNYSKNPLKKVAISGLWIYGLISSISDTVLTSYRGIAIALITALFMSISDAAKEDGDKTY